MDRVGNSIETARLLRLANRPQALREAIGGGDRADVYAVRLRRRSSLALELTHLTATARLHLLDASGRRIQVSTGASARSHVLDRTLAKGLYYIRVVGGVRATPYRLRWVAHPDLAGQTLQTARHLGPLASSFLREWVGRGDRHDVYRFQITQDQRVRLSLKGLSANANLHLLDHVGSLLQASRLPGKTPEQIDRVLTPGHYALRVVFPGRQLGTRYTLSSLVLPANAPPPDNGSSTPPLPLPDIALSLVASGVQQPTHITHAGDGSDRLFVVEKGGRIRILQNGVVAVTPFLDIRDRVRTTGEEGLLSVAFPPDYARKGYVYVYYTNQASNNVVARFRQSADPNVLDPASEEIILTLNHPTYANHNGGQIAFGPDGYLYIATGDGGGAGDPNNNAQNPQSLLGKLLRIDVESGGSAPYQIPETNPFVGDRDRGDRTRDEIWALGLRNPWRFSFDRVTGDLYIADVGQSAREEINVQGASSLGGENYGWNILEGSQRYANSTQSTAGLVRPVVEYDRTLGQSVTGGLVYRGSRYPALQGVYLYGDFVTGNIWGLRRVGSLWENKRLLDSPYQISTFGDDAAGNLYLAHFSRGEIYQLSAR